MKDSALFAEVSEDLENRPLNYLVERTERQWTIAFYVMACAIHEVLKHKLYKDSYTNVEEWAAAQFGWSDRRNVYYYETGYKVITRLIEMFPDCEILPRNVNHTRVLERLDPSVEEMQLGWFEVMEEVKSGANLTGPLIERVFRACIELSESEKETLKESTMRAAVGETPIQPSNGVSNWTITDPKAEVLPKGSMENHLVSVPCNNRDVLERTIEQAILNPEWYFACLTINPRLYLELNSLPGNVWLGYEVHDQDDFDEIEVPPLLTTIFLYLDLESYVLLKDIDRFDWFVFAPNQEWEIFKRVREKLPTEKVNTPSNVLKPEIHYPISV